MGLFSRELHTAIEIEATPERLWLILSDTDGYPRWNPFIDRIVGPLVEGGKLEVHFAAPDAKVRIFRPTLLTVDENRELRWFGRFLLPLLFDGEHFFRMEEVGKGRTRFVQGEILRGLLVPLLWQYLDTNTRHGFETMNRALKSLAEGAD
jgi:hypothetical protein